MEVEVNAAIDATDVLDVLSLDDIVETLSLCTGHDMLSLIRMLLDNELKHDKYELALMLAIYLANNKDLLVDVNTALLHIGIESGEIRDDS